MTKLADADGEYTLLSTLILLAKRKKLVLGLPLVGATLALVVGMLMPPVYRSSTTLLPPLQNQSAAGALLAQLGGATAAVAGAAGMKSPNDLYIGMLGSRTIADKLIARYDLLAAYDTKSPEVARRKLQRATSIASGKDGLITVDVEDKDRERAARLANGYVEELLQLTKVLAVTDASQRRKFYERELGQAKDDLAAAEFALKNALDSNGVISVDSDSRAVIETVGRLRAQISAKEVQLSAMKSFVTSNNQDFKVVEKELTSLRSELSRLQGGSTPQAGAIAQEDGTPQVEGNKRAGLENIKLLRNVKYYQMLYELLGKQYEVARLDEAKDPSIIQVLDHAIAPERQAKPNLAFLAALGLVLGLVSAVALAVLLDARERLINTSEGARRWALLASSLRGRAQ